MPLDGNDSGAIWQGPPTSQPQPTKADIHINAHSVPLQNAQIPEKEHVPAYSPLAEDSWQPSLEDDVPQEDDEQFTPSKVTPIRTVSSTPSASIVDGSAAPATARIPASQADASLHLASENSASATGTQRIAQPRSSKSSKPRMLVDQISFYSWVILVPFLFAVLTGLIILPLVVSNRAYAPPQAFIPLIIALLVIAVAQSISISYVGTDNGLWAACTLTGFCLFLLIGSYTLFGALVSTMLFILFVALYIGLYRICVHPVAQGTMEIVLSFGQYRRTLTPGFNILFPWEQAMQPVSLKEIPWQTPVQRVQLTQTEDIVLRGHIRYQLQPHRTQHAILDVRDWEASLRDIFVAKLQDVAASLTPDSITRLRAQRNYTPYPDDSMPYFSGDSRWQPINEKLLQEMQSRVSQWGVLIIEVQVFDVALTAHDAYNALLGNEDTDPASYMQQEVQTAPTVPPAPAVVQATTPEQPRQLAVQAASLDHSPPAAQQAQPIQANVFKEEALTSAYRAVQSGAVKDPETIRNLARRFETVAKDPNLYQNVSFDAMRAAVNLLKEADRREVEIAARAGTLPNDQTKPDFPKPEDESSLFGA